MKSGRAALWVALVVTGVSITETSWGVYHSNYDLSLFSSLENKLEGSTISSFAELPLETIELRLDRAGSALEGMEVLDQDDLGNCVPASVTVASEAYIRTHFRDNGQSIGSRRLSFLKVSFEAILRPEGIIRYFGNKLTAQFVPKDNPPATLGAGDSNKNKASEFWQILLGREEKSVAAINAGLATFNENEEAFIFRSEMDFSKTGSRIAKMARHLNRLDRANLGIQEFSQKLHEDFPRANVDLIAANVTREQTLEDRLAKVWDLHFENYTNPLGVLRIRQSSDYKREKMKEIVRRWFRSASAQPLGINYCANYLEQASYKGVKARGRILGRIIAEVRSDCAHHASILAGYRYSYENDKEEVLVQNSWGTACYPYDTQHVCEAGKIWTSLDSFANNLITFWWIEAERDSSI